MQSSFAELLKRYETGELLADQLERFFLLLKKQENQCLLAEAIDEQVQTEHIVHPENKMLTERAVQALRQAMITEKRPYLHVIKKLKWRYVAAAILIFAIGSGVYYFNHQSYQSQKSSQITLQTKEPAQNIPPGSNKAIWTLASGKQIELDSSILDMTTKTEQNNIGFNELRTPRGGQYQLILPDGSKVWLNAASSIKYPVAFNGKERKVDVTGEAYFEIAKDTRKPFKVSGGGQQIEVLGTSFNINIYDNEPVKKTTLLTGSIKITHNNQTAILKPGQQANIPILSILPIRLIPVQTIDVIAWTSGYFNFEDVTFEELMRQLERWYDIDVVYEKGIPNIALMGKITKGVTLNGLLLGLEKLGVHYKLENKKLLILP